MNETLKLKLKNLPTSPGVYLYRNKDGRIIYIGKAKNLRNRVRTYFSSSGQHDPKTKRLVNKIADMELMVTDSEVEALILEANLIKEHHPHYNINLKDDKHFPYIKVSIDEPFPRITIVRRLEKDKARYFGPFTNAKGMRKTVKFLCRLFRIRTCHLTIPHPSGKKQKVCLDYQIGRCLGPCEELQSEQDYRKSVDAALMFLSGRSKTLIEKLQKTMTFQSKRMKFEEAAHTRDQIDALQSIFDKQKIDAGKIINRDIIAYAREGRETVVVTFQVREGNLIGRQHFQLRSELEEVETEIVSAFIRQYYNRLPDYPQELYLPVLLPDEKLLKKWLFGMAKRRVKIFTPQKGEKLHLIDMAASNARLLLDEILIQKQKQKERLTGSVLALKDDLNLLNSPKRIACVDISNTGESDAVGSLVYFVNGHPQKSEYRHFKIKEVKGQDDFAMMREVVGRYFFRLKNENKTPPDLLVVDGGKGQLSTVLKEMKSLGFDKQLVIGLAKKFEEIYFPETKEPRTISKASPGLRLLKQIRDEAHRFAIEYNRKVRSKRTIRSWLDKLEGVGPKRREILLKTFGSVKKIKIASLEELSEVKGIPKSVAEIVYKASH
ncbi:MAG: excinuclease ABC subunit UvrC [candidate division Zixibacteria bacterium]|nr:excinuclease ABC subunit UvrC [candidate division Zixibacteria bacterium]